jgi:hypothetical protein
LPPLIDSARSSKPDVRTGSPLLRPSRPASTATRLPAGSFRQHHEPRN